LAERRVIPLWRTLTRFRSLCALCVLGWIRRRSSKLRRRSIFRCRKRSSQCGVEMSARDDRAETRSLTLVPCAIELLYVLVHRAKEKAKNDAHKKELEITSIVQKQKGERAKCIAAAKLYEDGINEAEASLEDIDLEETRQAAALAKERKNLQGLEADLAKLRAPGTIAAEMKAVDTRLTELRQADVARGRENHGILAALSDANGRKGALESRLHALGSKPVITAHTKLMRRLGYGRADAEREELKIQELQRNGQLKSKVHGPLLAVLQVEDPHCAAYVENVITGKMATAWVVETQADWKTLRDAGVRTIIHAPPLTAKPRRQYNLDPVSRM
jgi:chromosome segregation ATPase